MENIRNLHVATYFILMLGGEMYVAAAIYE
jgi:hypothetical protein